jgi:hypothetical protein
MSRGGKKDDPSTLAIDKLVRLPVAIRSLGDVGFVAFPLALDSLRKINPPSSSV